MRRCKTSSFYISRGCHLFFFDKFLDPDTELGVSVSDVKVRNNWRHGNEYSGISVEYFFQKEVGGDISCIRHIYWSKGFSVKGPPAELSAIKVSLIDNQSVIKGTNATSNFHISTSALIEIGRISGRLQTKPPLRVPAGGRNQAHQQGPFSARAGYGVSDVRRAPLLATPIATPLQGRAAPKGPAFCFLNYWSAENQPCSSDQRKQEVMAF